MLVEGRTDIKTVHQFLRLLKKNHRIVVLNLRGAESINGSSESALELEEITRLSKSIYTLIDSERDGEGSPLEANRQAFLETCNSLDIECHVLGRRAIDNYLCERAVKLVKGPLYRQLGPYERLKDASPTWSKKFDNWRIAREMTLDELMANDLGEFLNSL